MSDSEVPSISAGSATSPNIETIRVGDGPHSVAASRDGSRVYVTNFHAGSVSVIDTSSKAVVATLAVGVSLYGVAVSPDGARLYVADTHRSTLSMIETSTGTTTIDTVFAERPYGLATSPDGARLYVANALNDAVLVTDGLTKRLMQKPSRRVVR
jgi:YVTN family beta-propeller protein